MFRPPGYGELVDRKTNCANSIEPQDQKLNSPAQSLRFQALPYGSRRDARKLPYGLLENFSGRAQAPRFQALPYGLRRDARKLPYGLRRDV
jgi:hypothetical protein